MIYLMSGSSFHLSCRIRFVVGLLYGCCSLHGGGRWVLVMIRAKKTRPLSLYCAAGTSNSCTVQTTVIYPLDAEKRMCCFF